MKHEQIDVLLRELNQRAKEYERILDTHLLEHCNSIVQVGAMTLTTNELREVIPQLTTYPTQFSEESVAVIMGITFYNGKDEVVKAEVFNVKDWYGKRLGEIYGVIRALRER